MVGVLVCYQSAAFDLCDHYLLVEKLKLMGLEDTAAAWVWSYLSGRQQSCFVDGQLSSPLNLLPCVCHKVALEVLSFGYASLVMNQI